MPQVYPGKLTLFRAEHQPLGIYPDPTLGWGDFISGELEIHEVPGHHGSIVAEPYVRKLADELSICIEKAQLMEKPAVENSQIAKSEQSELVTSSNL